jgi:hypothetical protein
MNQEQLSRRHYAGLMGPELKAVILRHIADEMSRTTAFTAGMMHHNPEFEVKIMVRSGLSEALPTEVVATGKQLTPGEPDPAMEHREGTVTTGDQIEYPDKAREETGLPLPDPKPDGQGIMSDYTDDPIKASEDVIASLLSES